jgi:xanthine dehydrogenase YagS FAD-binding subunit
LPSLFAATEAISSPQMLAVGTVGGDLCQRPRCWYYRNGFGLLGQFNGKSLIPDGQNRYHAVFGNSGPAYFVHPSSLAPALIALGATCRMTGPRGATRSVPAGSFFRTPGDANERETTLKPNEILTAIEIPLNGAKNATYEIRHRHGLDWPYVTASVAFKLDGATASGAHVVLGHVAPVPWNAQAAAKVLDGSRINDDLAARCGQEAAQGANPLSQNAYKVQLVKTAVKRAVLQAAGIKTEA